MARTSNADSLNGIYHPNDYRVQDTIAYLLHQVRARLMTALDAEFAPIGITWAQGTTLFWIANSREVTSSAELCRVIGCDTGSMTRMLDRLERKALIRRERSVEDRRVVNLTITAAGNELCAKLPPMAEAVFQRFAKGFSVEELLVLKGFLRRLLANADVQ